MKALTISSVTVLALAASTIALAQWPRYTVPGIPLAADGTVDLDAPTPRAVDGKPDLSGVWEIIPCIDCPDGGRGRGRGGRGRGNGGRGRGAPTVRQGGGSPFGNIGSALPEGAPYQDWAADLVAQRMADNSKDNPDAQCLPMGIAQMNAHPYPRKIIQTPTEVVLIYEGSGTTVREVYLDGRPLPPADAEPWWNGYSIGHWEGDTLVVETSRFMDEGWLDVRGSPLTSAGKITERFHRPRFGYLELEETIDDPTAYSEPFTAKMYYRFGSDTQLIEFFCLDRDAEHYVGASGVPDGQ